MSLCIHIKQSVLICTAETIQRMLANLPPKRATRKIMSLKDGFHFNTNAHQIKTAKKQTPIRLVKKIQNHEKGKLDENVDVKRGDKVQHSNHIRTLRRRGLRVLASRILDTNSMLVVKRSCGQKLIKKQSRKKLLDKKNADTPPIIKTPPLKTENKTMDIEKSESFVETKSTRSSPRIDKKTDVKAALIPPTQDTKEKMSIKKYFSVKKKIKLNSPKGSEVIKTNPNRVNDDDKKAINQPDKKKRCQKALTPQPRATNTIRKSLRNKSFDENVNCDPPSLEINSSVEKPLVKTKVRLKKHKKKNDSEINLKKTNDLIVKIVENTHIEIPEISEKNPKIVSPVTVLEHKEANEDTCLKTVKELITLERKEDKELATVSIGVNANDSYSNADDSRQLVNCDAIISNVCDKILDTSETLDIISDVDNKNQSTCQKLKRKLKKPIRGLNDCIAMLTSKLIKNTEPLSVVDSSSSRYDSVKNVIKPASFLKVPMSNERFELIANSDVINDEHSNVDRGNKQSEILIFPTNISSHVSKPVIQNVDLDEGIKIVTNDILVKNKPDIVDSKFITDLKVKRVKPAKRRKKLEKTICQFKNFKEDVTFLHKTNSITTSTKKIKNSKLNSKAKSTACKKRNNAIDVQIEISNQDTFNKVNEYEFTETDEILISQSVPSPEYKMSSELTQNNILKSREEMCPIIKQVSKCEIKDILGSTISESKELVLPCYENKLKLPANDQKILSGLIESNLEVIKNVEVSESDDELPLLLLLKSDKHIVVDEKPAVVNGTEENNELQVNKPVNDDISNESMDLILDKMSIDQDYRDNLEISNFQSSIVDNNRFIPAIQNEDTINMKIESKDDKSKLTTETNIDLVMEDKSNKDEPNDIPLTGSKIIGDSCEDVSEMSENQKSIRPAKAKALESIIDDALFEMVDSDGHKDITGKVSKRSKRKSRNSISSKKSNSKNKSLKSVENKSLFDAAKTLNTNSNVDVFENIAGDKPIVDSCEEATFTPVQVQDANGILRRSGRNCRKVTSYDEDSSESIQTTLINTEPKELETENQNCNPEKLQIKLQTEEKPKLNSDELFDLLKATPCENIVLTKPTTSFLDGFEEITEDFNSDSFGVFENMLEKSMAVISENSTDKTMPILDIALESADPHGFEKISDMILPSQEAQSVETVPQLSSTDKPEEYTAEHCEPTRSDKISSKCAKNESKPQTMLIRQNRQKSKKKSQRKLLGQQIENCLQSTSEIKQDVAVDSMNAESVFNFELDSSCSSINEANKSLKSPHNFKRSYCEICDKSFSRVESLTKHKRTLTHISKLSEIEAIEAALKTQSTKVDKILENPTKTIDCDSLKNDLNLQTILNTSESNEFELPSSFPTTVDNTRLKLADIINDVLNKPVLNITNELGDDYEQKPTDNKVKRYRSLGERKSFDAENSSIALKNSKENIDYFEPQISKVAGTILEKQITLLQNIIENRSDLSYMDDVSVFSVNSTNQECITPEESITNTKEEFSNSTNKLETEETGVPLDTNENTFLKQNRQFDEISEESSCKNYDETVTRKVLNRDEELFLECCSLLKGSSEKPKSNVEKRFNESTQNCQNSHNWSQSQMDGQDESYSNSSRFAFPEEENFDSNSDTMMGTWNKVDETKDDENLSRNSTTFSFENIFWESNKTHILTDNGKISKGSFVKSALNNSHNSEG